MIVLIVLATAQRRGAETEGVALASELRARGLDASAVALAPAPHDAGLEVDVLGGSRTQLRTVREVRRRARAADIVIAFGSRSLPVSAAALTGTQVPLIYRSIGNPDDWAGGQWRRRRTAIYYRRVDHVAALWSGAAAAISRLYHVPAAATSAIPNFRSSTRFAPPSRQTRLEAREALGCGATDLTVAFVGTLATEKRPALAVRAAAIIKEARLIVAGDGPLRSELQDLAAQLTEGCVTFLGVTPAVTDVYAAADVVLLTSSTEGMPGVLIEAALSGVPAVATDVGAVAELAANWCTIERVAAGSEPEVIADAVRRAAQRHGEAREKVPQIVETYGAKAVVSRWCELLETIQRSARFDGRARGTTMIGRSPNAHEIDRRRGDANA